MDERSSCSLNPADSPSISQHDKALGSNMYGPALPPGFTVHGESSASASRDIIGPSLPPGFIKSSENDSALSGFIGPVPPPGFQDVCEQSDSNDSSEGSVIGPLPCEAAGAEDDHRAIEEFERRAKKMRTHLLDKVTETSTKDTSQKREEWMTELPDDLGLHIGLGPRSFRKQAISTTMDRSAWTDTPLDKNKKQQDTSTTKHLPDPTTIAQMAKDEKLAADLEDYNKSTRPESLLNMHKKKQKQKAMEESQKAKERRPFSREDDLQIRRLDALQAKKIVDKAQLFNSRFSHGSNQFL